MTKRDGKPVLLLRVANERLNNIVEAQARLIVLLDRRTAEGEFRRVSTALKLSSSTRNSGFLSSARAIANRCR